MEKDNKKSWLNSVFKKEKNDKTNVMINDKHIVNENIEKIKKEVKDILQRKIDSCKYWSKEKMAACQNTIEEQTNMAVDYICEKAKGNLGIKLDNIENSEELEKLDKESKRIAENEAKVNPDFDIDAAIEREEEIKKKIENGELTKEEAKMEFAKPIDDGKSDFMKEVDKIRGITNYDEMYDKVANKNRSEKTQSERYSESLKVDIAKSKQNYNSNKDLNENNLDVHNINEENEIDFG